MLADNEQARRFRTRSATAWHALLEGSRDVLPTSAHSGLSGSLPANVARAQPAPSRMPESEQFESISRQFVDGRYWARTSDLLLVRQLGGWRPVCHRANRPESRGIQPFGGPVDHVPRWQACSEKVRTGQNRTSRSIRSASSALAIAPTVRQSLVLHARPRVNTRVRSREVRRRQRKHQGTLTAR